MAPLNQELGKPHPNMFRFIEIIQQEQQIRVEQQVRLLQAGQAPAQQRPKYRRVTERLLRLKTRLINNEITGYHYAGAVAGTLKMQ